MGNHMAVYQCRPPTFMTAIAMGKYHLSLPSSSMNLEPYMRTAVQQHPAVQYTPCVDAARQPAPTYTRGLHD